jgi:PAS domain S-box-containing protein
LRVPPIRMSDEDNVVAKVIRSRESQMFKQMTSDMLRRTARNEEHYRLLMAGGMGSSIITPLIARGECLGAMTLVLTKSPRQNYQEQDLAVAEDLASRAALAIDNARLYQQSQDEIEERRRAEDALRRSEERYRAFIEQSTEAIWRFELDRPISVKTPVKTQIKQMYQWAYLAECNEIMPKMYGLESSTDLVGKRLGDLLPIDNPHNQQYLQEFIRSGYRMSGGESQEPDRFGNVRHFMNNLVGIIEDGKLVRAWGMQSDVTEHREHEAERDRLMGRIQESEALLQAVLEQMPAGVIITKAPEEQVLLSNTQVEEILPSAGSSMKEALGEAPWERFYINGQRLTQEAWPLIRSIRDGHIIVGQELEFKRTDGARGYISLSAAPIRRTDGQIMAAVATFNDITDRKEAEEALAKSYNILNAVIQGTNDVVFVKNLEGQYILANPAAAHVFRHSVDDILGKTDADLFPPDEVSHRQLIDQLVVTTGAERTVEEQITIDGQQRTYLTTKGGYRDQEKHIIGIIGVAHDITERKDLERQKDEFLGIASHELKTPVTSIKAFTQILQRKLADQKDLELLRYLDKMDLQLNKLTGLINSLLDVTKIQSGKLIIQEEVFSLSDLVHEIADDLQPTTDRHRIVVRDKLRSQVRGDRDRLGQVLTNLLANAIKYSPQADKIEVVTAQDDQWVHVDIRDYGIGIAESEQQHIFDRFYQSPHRTTTISGLGLGLYISTEIVQRHHGKLTLKSNAGKGSTFRLSLPVVPERVH